MNAREGETREITVIRSGSAVGEVTVVLNVSLGGTATLGEDFTVELPLGRDPHPDGQLFGRVPPEPSLQTPASRAPSTPRSRWPTRPARRSRATTACCCRSRTTKRRCDLRIAGEAVRRVTEAGEELPIEVTRERARMPAVSVVLLGVPGTAALGIDYSDLT
jgi:hypothetical protein